MASAAKFIGLILSFTLGVPLLFSTQTGPSVAKTETYADPDGYAVLSLLLDRGAPRNSKMHIYFLTVEGKGARSESCDRVPAEFKSALKDFLDRNSSPLVLARRFSMQAEYELVEKMKKAENPFPPPGPGEQEVQYELMVTPESLFSVSAVGFDKTRTYAIAYVQAICGAECAGGGYHLLTRDKHGWKEIKNSPVCEWMS